MGNNLPDSYNLVEIDLGSLRANYRSMKALVGDTVRVMAVIKSDAYGHGLVPVAEALELEGAEVFGVAEAEEGVRLRRAGIRGEIVVLLGAMAEAFPALVEHGLQPVVFDRETLKELAAFSSGLGARTGVHLKVDTGMGRLGIMPEELGEYLDLVDTLPGVALAGILSHFPKADDPLEREQSAGQCRRFAELLEGFAGKDLDRLAHMANSAAICNFPESHFAMVRPGITLYGYHPGAGERGDGAPELQPVMSFRTRILQVKEVPAGHGISYGHTHVTERPTRLAVLPVGYDDGYLRGMSGRAEVLVGGQRVPLLGRICMNACMADVTGIPGVKAGDEAVLLGRQGGAEITADDLAGWAGTISYEVLCLLGGLNRRAYRTGEGC